MTAPKAINLQDQLNQFSEPWSPRIVGQFHGHDIMVAKFKGEFVWHAHDDTDDFFLVLSGHVILETEQGTLTLGPGEVYVVPKGVRHRPRAEQEAQVLLIEPAGTPNTGDAATAVHKPTI